MLVQLAAEASSRSDRSLAVAAAATLETVLQVVLRCYFARDDKFVSQAFDHTLSNLNDKISAAYCIGIINQGLLENLRLVAKIRNAFAHDVTVDSFLNETVRTPLEVLFEDQAVGEGPEANAKLRDGFIQLVSRTASSLHRIVFAIAYRDGSLHPVDEIPKEQWDEVLATDLELVDDLGETTVDGLRAICIRTVGDFHTIDKMLLIRALGPEVEEVRLRISLWEIGQLLGVDEETDTEGTTFPQQGPPA